MSDEKYVGAVAAAKQAALMKAYVDSKVKKDFVVNITFDSTSAPAVIDDSNLAVFNASADKTFAEISAAVAAGKNVYGMWNGHKWPLYLASSTSFAFRGHIQLSNLFGTVGLAIAICSIWQDGCNVEVSAGELPAPALDGSDDGKVPTVNGMRWEMKKAVVDVDDALSDTSTNPVQNKVVKAALDGKASTEVASQTANGLMSKDDKQKLDDIEYGANKTVVDAALYADSTNPVQNKAVKAALDTKAGTAVASQTANGLMSAEDKFKLDRIEDGATRVIVDDYMSGTSTNPVQNKVVKKYIDDHNFLPDPIPNGNAVQAIVVDRASRTYKWMTFDNLELPGAAESTNAPQTRSVKYLLDRKASKDAATEESDGLMSALDKTKLDGIEDGANKTVVDAALDDNSKKTVKKKGVKAAMEEKAGRGVGSRDGNGWI